MSELTVGEIVQEYLVSKVAAERAGLIGKQALIRTHHYCLAFAEDFGQLRLSECRRGDLRRWLLKRIEYKSPHTKHQAVGQIITCFRWAAEDGLIQHCPYSKPKDLPACEPRPPIEGDEVRQLLASAKGWGYRTTQTAFRLAIWFLWETGCRPPELYRLRWEDYDDERGCFELVGKTTAKTGRKRIIALPRRAWRFIRWLRCRQVRITGVAAGLVFRNGRGTAWNKGTFDRIFAHHARVIGLRRGVTPYSLRHGFTCEALEGGCGERQLADYLGHTSTQYISYYGRRVKTKVDFLREVGETRRRKGFSLAGPWLMVWDWLETAIHFLAG